MSGISAKVRVHLIYLLMYSCEIDIIGQVQELFSSRLELFGMR